MVGVIWAVQLVIYPQFRSVSPADGAQYVADHSTRIVTVLAVFAPIEVLLALLVWLRTPGEVSATLAFVAGALLAAAWVSTAVWFAPLHGRLQDTAMDPSLVTQLIHTNWVRTVLWTARGVLALSMLWISLDP